MDEILTTHSPKHGERRWTHIGEREHVTSDGRSVTLKVWRGSCVQCGAAYDVASTGGPQTRAFGVVHCKTHRGKRPPPGLRSAWDRLPPPGCSLRLRRAPGAPNASGRALHRHAGRHRVLSRR